MATTPKPENTTPAPEVTSMEALQELYRMKAHNRNALITVLAVEHSALFVELARRSR